MEIVLTLKNGLRLVYENIPYVRSVSVGVWIDSGSRREDEEFAGMSHFIEHMLFKGTQSRTARDIAEEIDSVGGQINAFTARDCTCFYTKTLDEHLDIAIDLLSDMILRPLLAQSDIELERGVILEEISMYEDTPDELVHDLLYERCYNGHPIGRNILGYRETVSSFDSDKIRSYMREYYIPSNTVIAVSGNFEPAALVELVERHFGSWHSDRGPAPSPTKPVFTAGEIERQKDIEQTHICMAFPAVPYIHPDIYAVAVVSNLLGGGMSSRLFQHIREEKGLAYSVHTFPMVHSDCGFAGIYAACSEEKADEVMSLIMADIDELISQKIGADELHRSKEQLKGAFTLGRESVSSRMSAIGKQLLLYGEIKSEDQVLNGLDAVTVDHAMRVAEAVFGSGERALAIVKPKKK